MPLEPNEQVPDFIDTTQNFRGITDGLIFQMDQVGQLCLVQFFDPGINVFEQDKFKETGVSQKMKGHLTK